MIKSAYGIPFGTSCICLSVAVGLCLFSGCGAESVHEPMGQVLGKVSLNGGPWVTGQINFVSPKVGASAFAALQADGTFELPGELPVGEYKVFITPAGLGDTPPPEPGNGALNQSMKGLPPKYQSEATTEIVTSIMEGLNPLDFDLKS